MTILGSTVKTLSDLRKEMDPDGKHADIVEVLEQVNEVLDDMPFKESNMDLGHKTTIRTGLPDVYWKLMNQKIPASKSTAAEVVEGMGMLTAFSKIDEDLAEVGGNPTEKRLSEGKTFLEAMSQEGAATLFYGNSSLNPEEFLGFAVRYSSLSAANAQNIIDGGGTGSDNMSIWLIGWGDKKVFGIYPKGSKAGVDHKDLGVQVESDTNGEIVYLKDKWIWKLGLVVEDWRYVVRICNIDTSLLTTENASAANLSKLMIKAMKRIPQLKNCKPVFYMNRTAEEFLDIQRLNTVGDGGGITYENVDGVERRSFRGVPVKIVDALLETEARIV